MTRPRRPHFVALLFALVLLPGSGSAATVWVETRAKVDTVVADTATLAPVNPLAPLTAPVPFKGFRYPHVDGTENVTFIADDPCYVRGGVHHGIYRSFAADGHLQTLVSEDDLIPGTQQKLGLLRGLQMDEDGNAFVFNATSMGDDNNRGLFYWSDGKLTAIARTGVTFLPGDTKPLADVHWGAVHSGRIVYAATAAAERPVFVLHDLATGTDRVLLRGGDAIPGHPGEKFRFLAHQDWLDANSIVFRAAPVALDNINTFSAGPKGGVYGWFNIRWDDPASFALSRLVTLADEATAAPLLEDQRFTEFYSAPVSKGLVVCCASSGAHDNGIYFSRNGSPLRPVVDTETEMAGLFRGKFTSFGVWPAAVENGVVFTARAGNFTGVFLYRTDQEALYLLADNRTPVEGKEIAYFELGSHPLVGNRFAVTANFVDKTAGVYLATIPPHAYNRLTATATVAGE